MFHKYYYPVNSNTDSEALLSFNKRPEDFIDLRSYNDYLEEVEDISRSLP